VNYLVRGAFFVPLPMGKTSPDSVLGRTVTSIHRIREVIQVVFIEVRIPVQSDLS